MRRASRRLKMTSATSTGATTTITGARQAKHQQRRTTTRGVSALMYASQQGDVRTVRKIIKEQSSSIFSRDRTGKSALHYTCTSDKPTSAQAADILVMAAPDLVESHDEDGFTPLHLAVIAGNIQLVTFLLANKADVNAVDNEKHTVVHWATVCGETVALRSVLAAGAPVSTPDVHGGYPLHYAAQMCGGDKDQSLGLQVLQTLLTHSDIQVSVEDGDGRQPLLWAASAGSAKAVLALIRAGAAVEAPDKDGLTALHCAASRGHTDCIDTLLTLCGASPDVIDSNGCTALHYAVTLGHADATALLLAHGADPNRQDRKGRSPAHCGCAKGQFETVKMIGAHGANLWLRNARGDLPLHEAAASGRRDLVRWLLDMRPSQVNARNNDGRCPLHLAALNDNADMCKILLDAGAQINPILRTSKNTFMTPLDCALQRGFRSTAKFLQLHGGIPASRLGDSRYNQLRGHLGSGVNLQIRDDVTFWGDTSSDSERENGDNSRKMQRKRLSHKFDKKRATLSGSDLENNKVLISGKARKKLSEKNRDIDNSGNKRGSSRKTPTARLDYSNEIIINGKTEINIQQSKQINLEHDNNIRESNKSTVETIVENEKRPKSAKRKSKSSNGSAKQTSEKKIEEELTKSTEEAIKAKVEENIKQLADQQSIVSNTSEDMPEAKKVVVEADLHEPPKNIEASTEKDSAAIKQNESTNEQLIKTSEEESTQNEEATKLESKLEQEHAAILEDTENQAIKEPATVEESFKDTVKTVEQLSKTDNSLINEAVESIAKTVDKDEISLEAKLIESELAATETSLGTVDAEDHKKYDEEKLRELETGGTESTLETESKEKMIETEVEESINQSNQQKSAEETVDKGEINSEEVVAINKVEKSEATIEEQQQKSTDKSKKDQEMAQNGPETEMSTTREATNDKTEDIKEGDKNEAETAKDSETAATSNEISKTEHLKDSKKENQKAARKRDKIKEHSKDKNARKSPKTEKVNQDNQKEDSNFKNKTSKTKKNSQDPSYELIYKTLGENEEHLDQSVSSSDIESDTSSTASTNSVTAKEHKSFRVLDDKESKEMHNLKKRRAKSPLKKQRSRSQENIKRHLDIEKTHKSRIPTLIGRRHLSKSDKYLNNNSKMGLESRIPSLPNINQARCDSNMSAPIYNSDNERGSVSDGDDNSRKSVARKRKVKKRPKTRERDTRSAGSDYESSNIIDSGFEPSPRSSRIPKWKNMSSRGVNMTTVTQTIQSNIRRYHLERKIFQHLLDLKRLQIRAGQHNEAILVKRAIDAYHQSCASTVGAGRYVPEDFSFKSFEKFLYLALRKLQRDGGADYLKGLPETSSNPLLCTQSTHRCMHATHAYTGIPCAAYLPRMDHHTIPKIGFETVDCKPGGGFLPTINANNKKAVTLELCHGNDKQIISLPADRLDHNKRYYVTFTVKGGEPTPIDEEEPPTSGHVHSKSD